MRLRGLVVALLVVVAAFAAFGAWQWLNRPDTTELAAPDVAGTVVLIPGYGGGTGSLGPLASYLQSQGRTVTIVDIGDGRGDISSYGQQVAGIASAALAAGAPSVDLVGYSMGGLIARAAAAQLPNGVRRVATIASPHDGTGLAGLGAFVGGDANCPTACQQMAPGSEFLDALPVADDPTRWLSAWSAADDVIRPADSSSLSGATNIELGQACGAPGLDHGAIVASPLVAQVVGTFLQTGTVPPPCLP